LLDHLGVLGSTGLTAYFVRPPIPTVPQQTFIIDRRAPQGLTDVGQLRAGETLVVSGAAGATGSVVCQLGKIMGAKVIAIAGSDDKCKWLQDELGVDKALNYKSPTFVNDFKESVGYLDVYFDNGRRLLSSLVCVHRQVLLSRWRNPRPMLDQVEEACKDCLVWYVVFGYSQAFAEIHHRGDFRLQ